MLLKRSLYAYTKFIDVKVEVKGLSALMVFDVFSRKWSFIDFHTVTYCYKNIEEFEFYKYLGFCKKD